MAVALDSWRNRLTRGRRAISGHLASASRLQLFALQLLGLVVACGLLWQAMAALDRRLVRGEALLAVEVESHARVQFLTRSLQSLAATAYVAAELPPVARLVETSSPAALEELAAMYRVIVEEFPDIFRLRYIDETGMERLRVDRVDGTARRTPAAALQDKSDRDYFVEAMSLQPGELYVSRLDLNVENAAVEVPWLPTIRLAVTLADAGGRPRGIVIANFDADNLLAVFNAEPAAGQARNMLLDLSGYWLAGVPQDRLWGFMFDRPTTLHAENRALWRKLSFAVTGVVEHDDVVYAIERIWPRERIEGHHRAAAQGIHDIGWIVLTARSIEPRLGIGSEGGVLAAAAAVVVLGGLAWLWSGIVVDRRRAVEAEARTREHLIRAEKMASLGGLVAGIAHELNTPIGNAVTIGSTIGDRVHAFGAELEGGQIRRSAMTAFIADVRGGADIMLRGLDSAAELIGRFKQIAVDQSGEQRRQFELDAYVAEVVASIRPTIRHRRASLELEAGSRLAMDSYPGPLGQVLMGLVSNAFAHGFADDAAGTVRIATMSEGSEAVVTVTDTGRGMPPEILTKIFHPFFTTRTGAGGAGLGLSIVHGLVTEVLGGTVTVSSVPGRHTAFTVRIPCNAPAARRSRPGVPGIPGSQAPDSL